MTRVGLNAFRTAQPFAPFFIKMADGSRHEVRHPEMMAIGEAACLVFLPGDAWVQLDIRLMTEAGPIVPAPADRGA